MEGQAPPLPMSLGYYTRHFFRLHKEVSQPSNTYFADGFIVTWGRRARRQGRLQDGAIAALRTGRSNGIPSSPWGYALRIVILSSDGVVDNDEAFSGIAPFHRPGHEHGLFHLLHIYER